jgi:hypothetical protein
MAKDGVPASISMLSTWHRVAGPMSELMRKGRDQGAFPVHTFCLFEVLERCPESRSGPHLEGCGLCELQKWCHADKDAHHGVPKAKRSSGHYTIESAIQKVKGVTARVFESDYLCIEPFAAGAWFHMFDALVHVQRSADYDARVPVHLAVDTGVETGAIWFQVHPVASSNGFGARVTVFADYYSYNLGAEENAGRLLKRSLEMLGPDGVKRMRVSTDPSGSQRTAVGPTVMGEYLRVGLKGRHGLERWLGAPKIKKQDTLQFVEAMLLSADGSVSLLVHPRCKALIRAFRSYVRAQVQNQWMDYPKEPQHPHEDLIDPLAGALKLEFPEGRLPRPDWTYQRAAGVV